MKVQGKYNSAEIFTDNVDSEAMRQIYNVLNNPGVEGSDIAIMPDVHMGKGAVVGFTMTSNQYIIPTIIGVDIGCGIDAYKIGKVSLELNEFDLFVRDSIPSGREVHQTCSEYFKTTPVLDSLIQKVYPDDYQRVLCSVGTLGGGNHFIELEKDQNDEIWLVIHSGSRNLGLQVCHYHHRKAKKYIKEQFKGAGAYHGMEYMHLDSGGEEYLNDMKTAQEYASANRSVMARIIIENYFKKKISDCDVVSSIHNYFNFDDKIIRKGAIAAHNGTRVIIPLNMRDGSIIGTGKGNQSWNYSAPHGAGRLLSRSESKEVVSLDEYEESMKGIFSSSINKSTIDESPMVYKPAEEIIGLIQDTVEIDNVMKPVYNFKAGDI